MRLKLKAARQPNYGGLYAKINELAATGGLLTGTKLEMQGIEGVGRGRDEVVSVHFRIPREVIETKDETTGTIHVTSDGPQFAYTFTGQLSLKRNLQHFVRYFKTRGPTTSTPPAVKKLRAVPASMGGKHLGNHLKNEAEN